MIEKKPPMEFEELIRSGFTVEGAMDLYKNWGFAVPTFSVDDLAYFIALESSLNETESQEPSQNSIIDLNTVEGINKRLEQIRKELEESDFTKFITQQEYLSSINTGLYEERELVAKREMLVSISEKKKEFPKVA
jgi:hypothetical protein